MNIPLRLERDIHSPRVINWRWHKRLLFFSAPTYVGFKLSDSRQYLVFWFVQRRFKIGVANQWFNIWQVLGVLRAYRAIRRNA